MRVLVVDDDKIIRVPLRDDLKDAGYEAADVASAEEAWAALEQGPYDVVVSDIRMPGMDGIAFLEKVKAAHPETAVIMMTGYGTVENAVQAMKLGAYEYITKPFDNEELLLILDRVRELRAVRAENVQLKKQLSDRYRFEHIIGKSDAMRKVFELIGTISAFDSTVLIRGETGTGKEMVAHAIHAQSPRKDGPFVTVSCAALSKELLESELFGHEKGAFTSAIRDKVGKFQLADGGAIFLDEVDDIPLALQVKLLRVLQQHEFERVGGTETLRVDIRVIAATKVDLKQEVQRGRFREDLFYRLHVVPISLPPLRERKEDIPLLVDHFLDLFSSPDRQMTVSPEAMKVLLDYPWPGNVRELENLIERLVVIGTRSEVRADDLPLEIRRPDLLEDTPDLIAEPGVTQEILRRYRALEDLIQRSGILSSDRAKPVLGQASFSEIVEDTERDLIVRALDQTKGNKTRAAELLRMKLSTFRDKLIKLGLDK